jgi:hypothetical protein
MEIFEDVIEREAEGTIKISRVSPALVHRVLLEFPWPNQSTPTRKERERQ